VYGKFDLGSRIANVILYTVLQYAVSVKLQRRCHVNTLNRRSGLMKEDDRRALVSSVATIWYTLCGIVWGTTLRFMVEPVYACVYADEKSRKSSSLRKYQLHWGVSNL
jgi:hypothetical protein